MIDFIVAYLPWLLSAITVTQTVLAGNKQRSGWVLGLANSALWAFWIVISATWGLLPMTIALAVVYARNYVKWREEINAEATA